MTRDQAVKALRAVIKDLRRAEDGLGGLVAAAGKSEDLDEFATDARKIHAELSETSVNLGTVRL